MAAALTIPGPERRVWVRQGAAGDGRSWSLRGDRRSRPAGPSASSSGAISGHQQRTRVAAIALMQPAQAFAKILDRDPNVHKRSMSSLLESRNIPTSDIVRCCEILDVDALLCVAVSCNYHRIQHSDPYGFWYNIDLHTETEAVVLRPRAESAVARMQFAKEPDTLLDVLSDMGKLLSKGSEGQLRHPNPTSLW